MAMEAVDSGVASRVREGGWLQLRQVVRADGEDGGGSRHPRQGSLDYMAAMDEAAARSRPGVAPVMCAYVDLRYSTKSTMKPWVFEEHVKM